MGRRRTSRCKPVAAAILRRSSSRKVRFLSVIDDNCDLNSQALIEKAKESAAFGQIKWDNSVWDVSNSERQRSHKQRKLNLCFTEHLLERVDSSRTGAPFNNSGRFADLVKAIIRMRKEIGGQCASNQTELIIGFRYLYDELKDCNFDLTKCTREKLDAAANAVKTREREGTVYRRLQRLEEIARILDENGITRVRLDWQCSWNTRPKSLQINLPEEESPANDHVAPNGSSKLPGDGIIEAIAYLYHHIPKGAWADRVRICLISLLVITGFRIGELLTLPARRVETEDGTGRRYIVYYPEKGAPPQKKWLMTAGGQLAETIVDELLELTAGARAMAKWLRDNPGKIKLDGTDLPQPTVSLVHIAETLGLAGGVRGARQFLNIRKVQTTGRGRNAKVLTEELVRALRTESFFDPVNVVRRSGEELHLPDALACVFGNAFHSERSTLTYAVSPISEQQLSDFIRHRGGQPAAFERYGLRNLCKTPGQICLPGQARGWRI